MFVCFYSVNINHSCLRKDKTSNRIFQLHFLQDLQASDSNCCKESQNSNCCFQVGTFFFYIYESILLANLHMGIWFLEMINQWKMLKIACDWISNFELAALWNEWDLNEVVDQLTTALEGEAMVVLKRPCKQTSECRAATGYIAGEIWPTAGDGSSTWSTRQNAAKYWYRCHA